MNHGYPQATVTTFGQSSLLKAGVEDINFDYGILK